MEVFIFANPVTLQIVLSHFGDVNLTKVGKKSNAAAVEDLTGIKNYEARKEQISEMISKIHLVLLMNSKEDWRIYQLILMMCLALTFLLSWKDSKVAILVGLTRLTILENSNF